MKYSYNRFSNAVCRYAKVNNNYNTKTLSAGTLVTYFDNKWEKIFLPVISGEKGNK